MPVLTLHVDVPAPVGTVWTALVDWNRQGEWMLGTRVEAGEQDGVGVGGTLRAWTGVGRVGFWDDMTITRWEPPLHCDVVHTGRVVRGTGSFAVAERDGGSRFTWSEELELPWGRLGRLGWPLARPLFAAGVQLSLRRFARFAARG